MRARAWLGILAALALTLAACGTSRTEATGPKVSMGSVPATVGGNTVSLDLSASGMSIVKADGDTSGKTGHYHIFIDREPAAPGQTIPVAPGIVHAAASPVLLTGLSVGKHEVSVVLGDGVHKRVGTSVAKASFTVEGPSIDASAPASVKAGSPVVVEVKVEGVTLVKADGDTSGKTGHLHLFIDRDPTAEGQAIPVEAGIIHSAATRIEVPGLAAGDHTIWVVLGDGVHKPFAPRVADKVTVTVSA